MNFLRGLIEGKSDETKLKVRFINNFGSKKLKWGVFVVFSYLRELSLGKIVMQNVPK